jgi:allantoinase
VTFDLVVRGGTVHLPDGPARCDVGCDDGLIVGIGPELSGGREEVDATGLHVLPGFVDAHVHLNDPGRTHWEGFASGTAAMAAGGTTAFADMPLNAIPATVDGLALQEKLVVAGEARADYAFWGGLVPGPLDRLDELAAGGVCGFKAFLSESGVDEFARADALTLYEGMVRAAGLGLPVAVHCESEVITAGLTARLRAAGRVAMRDYLASRPVVAELEAIATALELAGAAGCHLHLVHVSTARGVALALDARARGVRVTVETCPHYLLLDADDAERIGALAKCAPPLRDASERAALAAAIEGIDLVASDHSPSPPDLKRGDDLFAVWGGIAGCQTLAQATLAAGVPVTELPRLLAASPARLLGIDDRKGAIAIGLDADLVVLAPDAEVRIGRDDLRYRHRQGPYTGRALRGRVVRRMLRGGAVFGRYLRRRTG